MKAVGGRASKYRWLARPVIVTALFGLGVQIGLACWDRLTLPYSNPFGVVSKATLFHYNPASNYLRYLFLLAMPIVLLLAGYFACPRKLKDLLFKREAPISAGPVNRRSAFLLTALVLLSILAALNYETEIAWRPLDVFHEGESLGASVSWLHGQAPYKDFVLPHGVIQDPLRSVIAFKLFGRSIGAVRTFQSILKIVEFILLSLCVMLICQGNWLCILTALSLFWFAVLHVFETGFDTWTLTSPGARDITTFAFLASVLALKNHISGRSARSALLIIGSFLCTFLPLAALGYSVDRGIYLTIGAIPILTFLYIAYVRQSRFHRHCLASSALGVAAGILLLNGLTRGSLPEFVRHSLITEPRYFALLTGSGYPITQFKWKAVIVLVVANAYWVTLKLVQEYHSSDRNVSKTLRRFADGYFAEFTLLVVSLLAFCSSVLRTDWPHMRTGTSFAYLLTSLILARHYLPRLLVRDWARKTYAVVLAVGLIAWSACALSRISSQELLGKNFPLATPDSEFAASCLPTAEFLKANLANDEYFYALTSEGIWYYLVDKPCPTRFADVHIPGPNFYQGEVIQGLMDRKVKFIIYRNGRWTNAIDGVPTAVRVPLVVKYIHDNYVPYCLIDDNEIWRIKEKYQ
jgi:hypothetical protein